MTLKLFSLLPQTGFPKKQKDTIFLKDNAIDAAFEGNLLAMIVFIWQ